MAGATSTTIRVQKATRDLLRETAEREHLTFDSLIREALEAHRWRLLRDRAAREAAELRADPAERLLAQEVEADLRDLSAW